MQSSSAIYARVFCRQKPKRRQPAAVLFSIELQAIGGVPKGALVWFVRKCAVYSPAGEELPVKVEEHRDRFRLGKVEEGYMQHAVVILNADHCAVDIADVQVGGSEATAQVGIREIVEAVQVEDARDRGVQRLDAAQGGELIVLLEAARRARDGRRLGAVGNAVVPARCDTRGGFQCKRLN